MEPPRTKKHFRLWGKVDRDVETIFKYQTSLFSSSFTKPIHDLLHRHYFPSICHSEFRLSPVPKINISAIFNYALENQTQSTGSALVSFEDTNLTFIGRLSTVTGGRCNLLTKYRLFRKDVHEKDPVKHSFFDAWANLDNENVHPNTINNRFIDVQNLKLGLSGRKFFSSKSVNLGGDLWYNFRNHAIGGSTVFTHYQSQRTSIGCEYEVSRTSLDLTKLNVTLSLSDSKHSPTAQYKVKGATDRAKSTVRIIEEDKRKAGTLSDLADDWHKPNFYDLSFKVMDFGRKFSASYYHQMKFKSLTSVTKQTDFWGNATKLEQPDDEEGYLVTLGGEFEHDEKQLNQPPKDKLIVGGEWQLGRDIMAKGKMATDGKLDLVLGGRLRIFPTITGTINYSTSLITNAPSSFGFSLVVEDS